MIRFPGADPAAVGGTTRVFAENIDVYRSLADLAGVPDVEHGVDGVSLAPLLRNPGAGTEATLMAAKGNAAFGQHAHCLRDPKHGYAPIDPFVLTIASTLLVYTSFVLTLPVSRLDLSASFVDAESMCDWRWRRPLPTLVR